MTINESPETLTPAMAETPPKPRKVDPFIALAVLFFLLAVALAAAPIVNAGPETLASMLARVSGPALTIGAAARATASRKNNTASAMKGSTLRGLGGVSAMAGVSVSGDSLIVILSQ